MDVSMERVRKIKVKEESKEKPSQEEEILKLDDEDEDDQYTNGFRILDRGKYENKIIYYDHEEDMYFSDEDQVEIFDLSVVSRNPEGRFFKTSHRNVGARGKGVCFVGSPTTLATSGIISCVGWLLYNESAAFLVHIMVGDPYEVRADGSIKDRVNRLAAQFREKTGGAPKGLLIHVQDARYGDFRHEKLAWMKELEVEGCEVTQRRGASSFEHVVSVVGPPRGEEREWEGNVGIFQL